MCPSAVESLILTGGQCLTAFGSHVSKLQVQNLLPTGFIHIKEQIYRHWLTQRCIKTKYNTYLLGNEDVLDHRNCSEREVALSLGLIIMRGRCVSGHVVRESF